MWEINWAEVIADGVGPGSVAPPSDVADTITKPATLSDAAISEIIEMALSDHVSFAAITAQHGMSADAVKALMRRTLKPGSYRAWRKRVRDFGTRRAVYK